MALMPSTPTPQLPFVQPKLPFPSAPSLGAAIWRALPPDAQQDALRALARLLEHATLPPDVTERTDD